MFDRLLIHELLLGTSLAGKTSLVVQMGFSKLPKVKMSKTSFM